MVADLERKKGNRHPSELRSRPAPMFFERPVWADSSRCCGVMYAARPEWIPTVAAPDPSAQLSAAVPSIITPAPWDPTPRGLPAFQVGTSERADPIGTSRAEASARAGPSPGATRAGSRKGGRVCARSSFHSVVICTRNRPDRLENCLSSGLSRGPAGNCRCGQFPAVLVQGPRLGLSAARNAGVLSCRSAVVAFTDNVVDGQGSIRS